MLDAEFCFSSLKNVSFNGPCFYRISERMFDDWTVWMCFFLEEFLSILYGKDVIGKNAMKLSVIFRFFVLRCYGQPYRNLCPSLWCFLFFVILIGGFLDQ